MECPNFYSISQVTGPAQCPGIDKVHGATVCSPGPGVSSGEIMVEAMSSVGTAIAIAERYGSSISSPNHRQSPEDGGDGQNIYNLLLQMGLIDQFWAALGDPQLWLGKLMSDVLDICTYYYTWKHAWWFQLDFITEGNICTLHVNRFFLAIYCDRHGKEKLQPTISDIVSIQHKFLHPWRTSEDKIFSILIMVCHIGEGQHCRRWCLLCIIWPIWYCNIPDILMCPSPSIAYDIYQ